MFVPRIGKQGGSITSGLPPAEKTGNAPVRREAKRRKEKIQPRPATDA